MEHIKQQYFTALELSEGFQVDDNTIRERAKFFSLGQSSQNGKKKRYTMKDFQQFVYIDFLVRETGICTYEKVKEQMFKRGWI